MKFVKPKAEIKSIASVLPSKKLSSIKLEERIRKKSKNIFLPNGIIESLTGVHERRILAKKLHPSDLAAEAARKAIINAGLTIKDIDCIIFASASGDILEPATANIIQENLQATCPVLDVKNACNSFLNGLEIAESFIMAGKYTCVLIVNGEVPTRSIRTLVHGKDQLRRSFAGYTLGDAGAAMIVVPSNGKSGILNSHFMSYGQHWRQSTILGGGSRYLRDRTKYYFEGETGGLKDIFINIGPKQIFDTLDTVGWSFEDIDKIIFHQVSLKSFEYLIRETNLPREKLVIVLPQFGNMASASIPVALDSLNQKGNLHKGDKLLLIGFAAGISMGTMAVIW